MDRLSGLDNSTFRFFLQREFMLHDLHDQHDKKKELAWVEENAARFSDYFDKANQNGVLERQYQRATDTEQGTLIDSWLQDMRKKDMKKAA